ncbi:MAG: hypothetical protein AVO35_09830 [Candidatus Aegiribacteria sp. MLS_C]|nr:MAG: hypothetical protein AVO35_09830 [Candidatus Aegiribacteria sp. MLS_C]
MRDDGLDREKRPGQRERGRRKLLDPDFFRYAWYYLFQCFLAMATVVGVLLVLDYTDQTAIIASIGASAFMVFTSPGSQPAGYRSLLGGYSVGVVSGVVCTILGRSISPVTDICWAGTPIVMGGVAVGLSTFLMVLTDTEHPPAAAIALALVINRWNAMSILVIGAAVLLLVLVRFSFKKHLRDLI